MIAKNREIPRRILMNEALIERLTPIHYLLQVIKTDLAKRKAGYRGELQLDYHLQFISKDKNIMILHDLRLEIDGRYFQIDTLLLTSYLVIVLEVKHISGTYTLDSRFDQAIRKLADKEEAFSHPVTQVERQKKQLIRWFTKMKVPSIPIATLVVMTNRSTVLNTTSQNEKYHNVVRVENVEERILSLLTYYHKEHFPIKQVRKLSNLLVKKHAPLIAFPDEIYGISTGEIITGVQCPECRHLPMLRKYGHWHCLMCSGKSKDAHISALRDYSLLLSQQITNKQVRNFLHLESRKTALNILHSLNLHSTGGTNNKTYHFTLHTASQTAHQSNSSTARPSR
ncbi:nuclease-related domain-containing protein [Rossellomorea aquimaris]|uniref:nuclease-related domain-containing protein n=1 Tax=Rossellomorea aquimaris TaxID=189382 RepID=UPI003CF37F5F